MKALRYLIAIIASFIVVFLLWVNYQAERMTIDPAPTVARVQGPAAPQRTPTIPRLNSSNARQLINRALQASEGVSLVNVRVVDWQFAAHTLLIPYYVPEFNTPDPKLGLDTTKIIFPRILCNLRAYGFGDYTITLQARAMLVDAFGESKEDMAIEATYSPATLARIRCDNLEDVQAYGIADDWSISPALAKSLEATLD